MEIYKPPDLGKEESADTKVKWKEFEKAIARGTLACEMCNKNNQAHITALEQHLSDMRLIVFGHYLKAEVKDVKKDQKPVQG